MKVGVPKEVKNHEYRVAITPIGVHELVAHGHDVVIQKDAGEGSSIHDAEFVAAGAKIVGTAEEAWGTDGGVHNFMRMLEDWGGQTIYFRGSLISLYTARQFIGTYKANSNTYSPGTRAFTFDSNFLQPTLLPPGTPMFRDVNTLRFRQILRPNQ